MIVNGVFSVGKCYVLKEGQRHIQSESVPNIEDGGHEGTFCTVHNRWGLHGSKQRAMPVPPGLC